MSLASKSNVTAPARSARITRGFANVVEGQIHYREAGQTTVSSPLPLVMLHASPGSAKMLEPLIGALALKRRVVAADTLGNGDSSAPFGEEPEISYFADAHLRAMDALEIEQFDLYGSHTGANIAIEIAITQPTRVNRLILDGVSLYSNAERADMLENYAPDVKIDMIGSQFQHIWHFVRDVYLFWPWYKRQASNRRDLGLPNADELHDKVIEVLKATRTFPKVYRAAIGYDKAPRLALVGVPTLLACAKTDMFLAYLERVGELMPGAVRQVTEGTGTFKQLASTVAQFEDFLDGTLSENKIK